jgi:hypothetical protein
MSAPTVSVAHGNVAINHVRKLAFDVERVRDGIEADSGLPATFASFDVLSTVSRLEQERRRKRARWSYDGWDEDDRDLWDALVEARNAADRADKHIADRVSGHTVEFTWHKGIPKKRETKGRSQYERRLGGHPVVPSLERVLALLQAEVK